MRRILAVPMVWCALCGSVALANSERAIEHSISGTKLLEQGKLDAAISEFEAALAIDSTYVTAQLNLAYSYERTNRTDDAINAYRRTLTLDSNNFFAHNNLGVLYDRKGNYGEAIAEFQRALKIRPGDTNTQANLVTAQKNQAIARERENQIARAQKQAQANPANPDGAYQVARIYAVYGMKEPALEWLKKAVRNGFKDFSELKADPGFNNLREEREFRLLLAGK
jgi:tetratricopeptide (TPR) repeat protein